MVVSVGILYFNDFEVSISGKASLPIFVITFAAELLTLKSFSIFRGIYFYYKI